MQGHAPQGHCTGLYELHEHIRLEQVQLLHQLFPFICIL
jgi:hypothetical protein